MKKLFVLVFAFVLSGAIVAAGVDSIFGELTLGVVVIAALIDSINPCAFGVLLFLMTVLLSMGSAPMFDVFVRDCSE